MFQLFADSTPNARKVSIMLEEIKENYQVSLIDIDKGCLLYTSPSPRDGLLSRMPSSA